MWNASEGIRGNQNDIESNTCTIVIQQLIFICKRKKKTTNKQKCQIIKDIFKKGFSRS